MVLPTITELGVVNELRGLLFGDSPVLDVDGFHSNTGLGYGLERGEIEEVFCRTVVARLPEGWERWLVDSGHHLTDVVYEKNGIRFIQRWHGIRASAVGVNNDIEVLNVDVRPL